MPEKRTLADGNMAEWATLADNVRKQGHPEGLALAIEGLAGLQADLTRALEAENEKLRAERDNARYEAAQEALGQRKQDLAQIKVFENDNERLRSLLQRAKEELSRYVDTLPDLADRVDDPPTQDSYTIVCILIGDIRQALAPDPTATDTEGIAETTEYLDSLKAAALEVLRVDREHGLRIEPEMQAAMDDLNAALWNPYGSGGAATRKDAGPTPAVKTACPGEGPLAAPGASDTNRAGITMPGEIGEDWRSRATDTNTEDDDESNAAKS